MRLKLDPRLVFGALILVGYLLALGTLSWHPVPDGNRELVSQLVGGLSTAVGMIVHSLWRPSDRAGPPSGGGGTP